MFALHWKPESMVQTSSVVKNTLIPYIR